MTTRKDIRVECRRYLADEGSSPEFSDESLNGWINDGIDEYNLRVGVVKQQAISGVVDQTEYSLNLDFRKITAVEFPKDNDPKDFLQFLSEQHPVFHLGSYYDVRWTTSLVATLVIGDKPASGEDIQATYRANADSLSDDTTAIEVIDAHLHLLRLFVVMRARQARYESHVRRPSEAIKENPGVAPQFLGHLLSASEKAESAYAVALKRVEEAPLDATMSYEVFDEYYGDRWA